MDVRCGRCGTEYEFDDALVSERGTTVKCTNCGHQFKVHPAESRDGTPERWVVRTASGRELVYTSLRELQRGIAQRQVAPEDLLARGNRPPRPLGSIAELEPFFQARGGAPPRAQPRTLVGVAPPPNVAAPAKVAPPGNSAEFAKTELAPRTGETPPLPVHAPVIETPVYVDDGPTQVDHEPPTLPRNRRPASEPPAASAPEQGAREPAPAAPAPAPAPPAEPVPVDPTLTPTPSAVRDAFRSYSDMPADPRFMSAPPSRRPTSRWIAGLVVLGAAALLIGTVGRRYLEKFVAPPAASAPAPDARVAEYLRKAETLMNDAEFEDARAELDKASALAEGNAQVLAELARLEALRADVLWLRLRLLDPADENIVKATHRQLGSRVGRAEEAVARAKSAAPEESAVVRADVDVLRLAGKLSEARARVAPIAKSPSEPQNAYVLAALDMAESTPAWAPVIDRLRTAAAAERGLGRARAALVYALVRDGRVSEAESELAKLKERGKHHPLFEDLTAFVERHAITQDAGVDAEVEVATVDPASLPVLDTSGSTGEGDESVADGDFRAQLKQASAAFKRGDLDRAEQLYNTVLAKQPGNTEALAGLGDVARQKRDPDTAQKMYEKVLEKNPSYLPALMAQADAKWEAGDRKGAQAIYKRILEQAGAGSSYGQKAAARLAEPATGGGTAGSAGGDSKPEPKPTATAAPEEPTEPPKKEDKPHIDTTDLPEFN